jgi:sodium pump decarboxylase gamma subunit
MPPLLSEGLNLVIYGMGTVFVFLTLLVLATMLMSWLVDPTKETIAVASNPCDSARAMKNSCHDRRDPPTSKPIVQTTKF